MSVKTKIRQREANNTKIYVCEGCNQMEDFTIEVKPNGNYTAKSKIEYIALSSLGYFITRAIDSYIGNMYRTTICNLIDEKSIIKEISNA